jgi:hypothetical protein
VTGETKLMYLVQCLTCGDRFLVENSVAHLPKHAPRGLRVRQDGFEEECSGSSVRGRLIQSVFIEAHRYEAAKAGE